MDGARACLIDVYETVLTCDFSGHGHILARLAGVEPASWLEAFPAGCNAMGVTTGRVDLHEFYVGMLQRVGQPRNQELAGALVAEDLRLLIANTTVFPDSIPFLQGLRARGVATAFVSNCGHNTRVMLDHFGLLEWVDECILSCEVGCAKPDPSIYTLALSTPDCPAADAVFLDDQSSYCLGARAAGMAAIHVAAPRD